MNKIYKVIWNATLSAWVAVSELAKGKTKSSKVTGIVGAATVSLMITFSSDVTANVINTDSNNCITGSNGIVGTINPGTTGGQATDGSGTYSTVAGCNAKGNGLSAVTAYGAFSEVTGNAGTAIGHNSQANAFGTAVGVESRATGVGSTALGEGSQSTGQNAVALGGTATGTASGNVVSVANAVTASGSGSVAIGGNATRGAQSTGTDSIAIGGQSRATNTGTIAIGKNAFTGAVGTESLNNIAIGTNASNSNLTSGNPAGTGGQIALGNGAKTTTFAQIAIGDNSNAGGNNYAIAIGGGATVTANSGVAVGGVAMGRNTQAGSFAVGVGPGAQATGANSTALGNAATANNTNSTALGNGAQATGLASTALGTAAVASIDNSVALGNGSTTTAITGTGFLTSQTAPTVGAVSVGNGTAAGNRRIQNVADGSAASDAVTVAQLDKAYDDAHTNLKNVLGGNAAYDAATNTYTAPTNIGGTGKTTIDDAIKATKRTVTSGTNIVVTPTTASDGSITYSVATSATPTFTSVTVNNAPTAGTDATNKTYVDSKAAASKTEVAGGSNIAGVAKTTGANGQDVYTVNANGTTASAGSSAVTVTAGTKDANNVTDYKVDLAASTKTDIQKGVDAKTAVDNTGLTFKGDTAATSTAKKLGDTVSITGDTNISTVATTNGVQVKLNPNLDLGAAGSVKTGNTTINNAGVTADQVTVGGVVINKTTGINAGGLAITNVAAPTAGTDATNKTYVDSKAAASKTEVAGGSNIAGVAKTTGANGQDIYTVNANGTTASAGSSAVTVTAGTKDANNVIDYKVDLAASTKTDIQKGVDAKTAVDNTGLTFKGDTAATSATKKLGDTVSITGDTNISTVATANGVQVKLNPNLDLGAAGSVKTGNTTINNAGVTADQVTVGGVVINNTTGINAGGKAITNVAAPTNNTDAANKKYVDDAGSTLTNLGFGLKAQDGTTVNKKLGEAVDIVGSNSNITTKVNAGKVEVALSNALDLGAAGSVTTGATVINNAGITANKVTVNNAPTVGTDATNKTYVDSKAAASKTEVAGGSNIAGVAKTTGANGQDIYTVNANGTTASAGSSAVTVTAGTKDANNVTDYKVDLAASTKTDIQKGVDAKTAVDNTGLTFKGDTAATSTTKKLGDTVSITGDTNISTVATANGVQVKLNPNLDLGAAGSVTTGATVINNAGITATQVTANKVTVNNAPTAGTDATNKNYVDGKVQTLADSPLGFVGDSGTKATRKLGEDLNIKGGATGTLTSGNIGVVSNGSNQLDIKLAEAIDLGTNGSVKTGNTTINNAGVTADQVTVGGVVINNTTGINAGGKAITNVAAPTNNTDAANKKYVDDAGSTLTNLGFGLKAQDGTTVNKKLGEAVDIVGSNSNITTKVNAGKVEVALSNALDLGAAGSVTTGATVINNAGITANKVTVNNAPTAGTDATNKTYVDSKAAASKTEVAGGSNIAGVAKTTGANGQDIYTVNANGTTASAGSSAVTVTAGTKDANNVTDYKVDLAASTKTDIQKGVDAKTAVDNTGLTFKGDTAATSATKKLGDTVSITGDTNISTIATTDGVQVKLNPNLDLGAAGSVITGNSKLDNSGLTITGGPSVTGSGINAANKNISNVADATTDDQAVNKGQLDAATTASSSKTDALGNSTATNLGGGSKYDNSTGAISAPSYVTTKTDGTTTTA
ncbi:ESPR-type extended signal peptide-containing protein, partial [Acinetobacter guillouiae]|uniref:ESPR-type extended signal peptide-containing protein n=1 Tax=Acinetobacter guillouiae TaxID=106649 RepID=UPI002479D1F2